MIDSLHVYLTAERVHLRRQTGWLWKRRIELLDSTQWDAQDPMTLKLPSQSGSWPHAQLHVYVGASLCKLMAIDIPGPIRDPAETHAIALAMMAHDFGIAAADWTCTVDRSTSDAKSVACAIRRDLLARLNAIATENRWRLASVRPLAGALWNAAQLAAWQADQPRALLTIEEDAFSVIVATAQRINSVFALPHRGEAGLVDRELRRLAYSSGAGGIVDARLALAASRRQMAADSQVQHALTAGDRDVYFADFRDMFFGPVSESSS